MHIYNISAAAAAGPCYIGRLPPFRMSPHWLPPPPSFHRSPYSQLLYAPPRTKRPAVAAAAPREALLGPIASSHHFYQWHSVLEATVTSDTESQHLSAAAELRDQSRMAKGAVAQARAMRFRNYTLDRPAALCGGPGFCDLLVTFLKGICGLCFSSATGVISAKPAREFAGKSSDCWYYPVPLIHSEPNIHISLPYPSPCYYRNRLGRACSCHREDTRPFSRSRAPCWRGAWNHIPSPPMCAPPAMRDAPYLIPHKKKKQ